jgi:hypothetical protein
VYLVCASSEHGEHTRGICLILSLFQDGSVLIHYLQGMHKEGTAQTRGLQRLHNAPSCTKFETNASFVEGDFALTLLQP